MPSDETVNRIYKTKKTACINYNDNRHIYQIGRVYPLASKVSRLNDPSCCMYRQYAIPVYHYIYTGLVKHDDQ